MKKIAYLIFIVLFLSGCGVKNQDVKIDIKEEVKKNEENITNNSGGLININNKNEKNNKVYSFDDLYKELIIKNNLEKKWNRNLFRRFVGFFNENKFGLSKYYFLNGFGQIEENGKFIKNIGLIFPIDFNKIVYILDKLNISNNLSFKNLNNEKLNIKYFEEGLFYNQKLDYFFDKKRFYEMNGICRLYSGELKEFLDIKVKNKNELKLEYRLKDKQKLFLNNSEYNKFINTKNKINDRYFVYRGLLSIVNKYIKSGYKKEFIDLFYKKFDEQISIYYSYSEYNLLFLMNVKEGKMNEEYCKNFSIKYFGNE